MKKILLLVDVPNWAWAYKARQIKRYLSNEFTFDIWVQQKGKPISNNYDLYMSFSFIYLGQLRKSGIPKDKIIMGATSEGAYNKHVKGKNYSNKCACLHLNSMMLYNKCGANHDKLFYVPNGVDTNLFFPNNNNTNGKLTAGYVGKPTDEKGLKSFIKPSVKKADVRLKTNTSNCYTSIPLEKMPTFYHNIDVYMVASIHDATPNPALEAAACGVPIISNEIGNMPEFIVNNVNGFINKERDVNFYVNKLNFFKNNPKRLKEMGIQARKIAVAWDWSIQVENYRKMFKEILGA